MHATSDGRFIMGTSSSLFNQALLQLPTSNESAAQVLVTSALTALSTSEEDIAVYPNPFRGVNASSNIAAPSPNLTLVDGVRCLLCVISNCSG